MKKVLITGASGFLGTYFFNWASNKNILLIRGTVSSNKLGFKKFYNNYSNIIDVLEDEDISHIIHFASVVPPNFESATFEETFKPNIEMMNNLYNFSIKKKVEKFVYISGFGSVSNQAESEIKDFYTLSKICGEHYVSLLNNNDIPSISLRVSSPYGEFLKKKNVISLFVDQALKNKDISIYGSGIREQNFVYAADVSRAINLSLRNSVTGIYDIVSPRNTNMLKLAKTIIKLTNSNSKIIFTNKIDPQENFKPVYNFSRAKDDLKFATKFELEEGLKKYIKWVTK